MEKVLESKDKLHKKKLGTFFNQFSSKATKVTGSVYAFMVAFLVIIVWAVSGPVFKFSDTWQLVINTGTTIVTFLMVFVIQHSQNKDTVALQLKLDELISASHASNKLISVEDLTEEELAAMKKFYSHLSSISHDEKVYEINSLQEQKDHIEESINTVKKLPEQ